MTNQKLHSVFSGGDNDGKYSENMGGGIRKRSSKVLSHMMDSSEGRRPSSAVNDQDGESLMSSTLTQSMHM